MLTGLFAVCMALLMSVWLQYNVHVHIRPFLDPALGVPMPSWESAARWNHLNSFPSDTATLFFGLAMMVAMEKPRWGWAAFAWALLTTGLERIAFCYHFPSDIAAAAVLGPGVVYALASRPWLSGLAARVIAMFREHQSVLNTLFFIAMAEAYTAFSSVEKALGAVTIVHTMAATR